MKMKEATYRQADCESAGFCSSCKEITEFSGVEPDADEYECPDCGNQTLMGISNALILGFITIVNADCQDEDVFTF